MRGKHFKSMRKSIYKIISLLLVLVIAISHVVVLNPVFAIGTAKNSLVSVKKSTIENTVFGKNITRDKFESINFVDNNLVPGFAIISWNVGIDESDNVVDTIKAWYTDFDENGLYELYIGQDGGVVFNPDSSYMFEGFSNVTYINMTNVDISRVSNVTSMFENDSKLETVYVEKSFSIDDRTLSDNMFKGCKSLKGQNGTIYDENNIDSRYAVVDKENIIGYFTEIVNTVKEENLIQTNNTNAIYNKEETVKNVGLLKSPIKAPAAPNTTNTKEITVTKIWNDNDQVNARPDDIKVYLEAKIAQLDVGSNVNAALKQLANNSSSYTADNGDLNVKAIKIANTLDTTKTTKKISSQDSSIDVYAWYDDNTIYIYSDASTIYLNKDSSELFKLFNGLTDISGLSQLDTSLVSNMNNMFANSGKISDLSALTNWNTSNVASTRHMFMNCVEITDLTPLAGWDMSNNTDMTFMFGCQNAYVDAQNYTGGMQYTSLEPLKNWNVSNVTTLEQTFKGATKLTTLEGLENWDVSLVTTANQIFEHCYSLTSYSDIKDWNLIRTPKYFSFATAKASEAPNIINNTEPFTKITVGFNNNYKDSFVREIILLRNEDQVAVADPTTTYTIPHHLLYTVSGNSWTKSGNTWTAKVTVESDYDYRGYEDEVKWYNGDALITSKKDVSGDTLTITNTLDETKVRKIKVTKKWDDEEKELRPDSLTFTVFKDGIPIEYTPLEYVETSGGYIGTDIPYNPSYTLWGDGNTVGGRL